MAHKIIWSEQARDDLQAVVLFIAKDNPTVAESFGYLLMSKVDMLVQFPLIGRVVSRNYFPFLPDYLQSDGGTTNCRHCARLAWRPR